MRDGGPAAAGIGEQRAPSCRRRPIAHTDWRSVFGGRRRRVRRKADRDSTHIDWYPAPLLFVAAATLTLSSADAALTLAMLQDGSVHEANPLMAYLLALDVRLFINVKTAFTASCLVFLVAFSHLRLFRGTTVSHAMYWLCAFYTVLVGYELLMAAPLGGVPPS